MTSVPDMMENTWKIDTHTLTNSVTAPLYGVISSHSGKQNDPQNIPKLSGQFRGGVTTVVVLLIPSILLQFGTEMFKKFSAILHSVGQ